MKRLLKLTALIMVTGAMLVSACDDGGDDESPDGGSLPGIFDSAEMPGDSATVTAGGLSFTMVFVPGGFTFPTGTYDDGTAIVSNAYWIGETEVTYELWQKVYEWATNGTGGDTGEGQYIFANAGTMGDGTGDTNQHPVTTINWRDAMVWCNALTEWYNAQKGTNYMCVYYSDSSYTTPRRNSNDGSYGHSINPDPGGSDDPYVSSTAGGFRLLSSNEWELAARYRGTDTTNIVSGTINSVDFSAMTTKWTIGLSASGDTDDYYNSSTVGDYAVFNENSDSSTAEVKSKSANALGLYDMSGNVWEWCFDTGIAGSREQRGGSWNNEESNMRIGNRQTVYPYAEYSYFGFRLARTH